MRKSDLESPPDLNHSPHLFKLEQTRIMLLIFLFECLAELKHSPITNPVTAVAPCERRSERSSSSAPQRGPGAPSQRCQGPELFNELRTEKILQFSYLFSQWILETINVFPTDMDIGDVFPMYIYIYILGIINNGYRTSPSYALDVVLRFRFGMFWAPFMHLSRINHPIGVAQLLGLPA